jgi:GNAT superfamily N-acetyltransferase
MDLYRRAIGPVWLESGRDHDMGRVEANVRRRVGSEDYWMVVAPGTPAEGLAGYLAWERHEDHTSSNVVAHLRMILVDPDAQGTGLGRALMDHFEEQARARGCTKILFDVVTGSPARAFYDSLGYRHWSDYMEKFL